MKKKLFVIGGIILAIIVVCGILILQFGRINYAKFEAEALKRLKEIYNKDFVVLEIYKKSSYFEVDVYPKDDPDLIFTASINVNDEGYGDNYVERYICKQIENQIYTNIGKTSNVFVRVNGAGPQPITFDLNQTIKEYNDLDPLNSFNVKIFVTEDDSVLYNSSTLFANLEYLNISGILYTVNQNKLEKVKDHLIRYPKGNNLNFKKLILDVPYRNL